MLHTILNIFQMISCLLRQQKGTTWEIKIARTGKKQWRRSYPNHQSKAKRKLDSVNPSSASTRSDATLLPPLLSSTAASPAPAQSRTTVKSKTKPQTSTKPKTQLQAKASGQQADQSLEPRKRRRTSSKSSTNTAVASAALNDHLPNTSTKPSSTAKAAAKPAVAKDTANGAASANHTDLKDNGDFVIDEIVGYRRANHRSPATFLVHWFGYDAKEDYTWERVIRTDAYADDGQPGIPSYNIVLEFYCNHHGIVLN